MPAEMTVPDAAEVTRRELAIIEELHGDRWIPSLSDAIGSQLAIRVIAQALAPFWSQLPPFHWLGQGTIQPAIGITDLEAIQVIVNYTGDAYPDMGLPVIVIGMRQTDIPRTAEVTVHIEDLMAEGKEPVHYDRTRIDVASPGGCTMYFEPVPGHTPRPIPYFSRADADTSTIDAAVTMGKRLALRLAEHYRLELQG